MSEIFTNAGTKVTEYGNKMTSVGTGMSKYVTSPIVAVGAASLAAFNEVDAGLHGWTCKGY